MNFFEKFLTRTRIWHAVCVVAALTPTYVIRFHLGAIPFTLFEVLILLIVGVTFVRACASARVRAIYKKKFLAIPSELACATALFVIAATISVFVAPDMRAALGVWRAYIIEALLFGMVVWLHLEHIEDVHELVGALSITVAVVSLVALVQKFTGWGIPNPFWRAAATRRVTSVFGYPNAVALYVELVIPFLVVAAWCAKKNVARAWFISVTLMALLASAFARSAGCAAALGGAAVFFLIAHKRTRWWTIGVVALGIGGLLLSPAPLKKKFSDAFLLQGVSGQLRVQMWGETIEMLRTRPIIGAGLAGYQARVKPYHVLKWAEIYLYPHNLILTLWSETGALGLISFAWIFALMVSYAWRVRMRVWPRAIVALGIIMGIHGLVDIPYFKNDFSALFWASVAIALFFRYTQYSEN